MKEFNLYGKAHKLEITDMFGDGSQLALYLIRVSDSKKIAYPTIWGEDLNDYETAKTALSKALGEINKAASEFYGKPASDKQGEALLEHLIMTEVYAENNELKL